MAITPLFVADRTLLLKQLKLDGTKLASDLIDNAIMDVRLGFYRRLTKTIVDQLLTYASVDAPATDQEIKRALANSTETSWFRLFLMRRLPVLFMDASGKTQQVWQEEAAFRNASANDIETEIRKLEDDIEKNLEELEGSAQLGDEKSVNVTVIEPDVKPLPSGASIYRRRHHRHGRECL